MDFTAQLHINIIIAAASADRVVIVDNQPSSRFLAMAYQDGRATFRSDLQNRSSKTADNNYNYNYNYNNNNNE